MRAHKINISPRRGRHLPLVTHVLELIVGLLIVAGGQGIWSVLVSANPDVTPPSVPTGLHMTGNSASSIDLAWDVATDDVAVTGYKIYRDGSLVTTSTTTNLSDSGLNPNTSYSYTVSAYDAASNESARSAPLSVSTLVDTAPPSVPTNLHQTGQTTSSITIAWNTASDNVGVTGYDIYRNGSLVRTQAGTSYTDTGLAVFSGYNYNVTAHDASNNASNLSTTLVASTAQDTTAPTVPDNVHKTASTVSSITLAWDAASDDVGVAGYRVYRDGSLVGSPGGTSFTDSGLNVSSSYTYTVLAYDLATNQSAQSAPYIFSSSNDVTAPTIPANLHTSSVFDTSINLAWDVSTDDVAVTGYKIYRDASLIGTSATASYHDSGLTPATNYSYTVQAYDAANNTSASSAALNTQTAFDTTPPTVPANLRATTQTDTSISLAWDAAIDNDTVAGYDIYRDGTLITSTVGTSYVDSGLAVHTSYSYKVRAHDASSNNSPQSGALVTSTLVDAVAPTAPGSLTSPSQTTTSVNLNWGAGSDDVAVSSYNVYRDGALVANVVATSYTDTGRHYNTSYSYVVKTVDASNNESPASPGLAASTLPDTTAPTVGLSAPTPGQTIQLTVPLSATASDDLDLARVEFYVDGSLITSITAAPFSLNWNSYAVHNGAHTITAKAIDASGNVSTQAAAITVTNPPPPITGDLNGDHRVNIFDLSVMLSHWNKAGAGDFNNNGRVDIFDLSVLLARYGQDNSNYN